jgi:hypothetical protein
VRAFIFQICSTCRRWEFPTQSHVGAGIGIVIQPHTPPPPQIIIHECDPPDDGPD